MLCPCNSPLSMRDHFAAHVVDHDNVAVRIAVSKKFPADGCNVCSLLKDTQSTICLLLPDDLTSSSRQQSMLSFHFGRCVWCFLSFTARARVVRSQHGHRHCTLAFGSSERQLGADHQRILRVLMACTVARHLPCSCKRGSFRRCCMGTPCLRSRDYRRHDATRLLIRLRRSHSSLTLY